MDAIDCDWCLVCDKRTSTGATYCSLECQSSDLISSSASSSASSASSSSSFTMNDPNNLTTLDPNMMDNYPMPPFVRKQRTSIPNIYAQCTSNPNPPSNLYLSSALTHHLHLQQQQQQQQLQQQTSPNTSPIPGSAATQYPLFYATLNALRPMSPSIPPQNQ